MRITATPVGEEYWLPALTHRESNIVELTLGDTGLRVVVSTSPSASFELLYVEYLFPKQRGFRFLEEGDLIRYWESEAFASRHHLYEITEGGGSPKRSRCRGCSP